MRQYRIGGFQPPSLEPRLFTHRQAGFFIARVKSLLRGSVLLLIITKTKGLTL